MTRSASLRPSELVKPGHAYSVLTVTTLKLGTVNEAFKEGKRAYAAQKYDDAVKHYTRALEALQTDISSVIHVHRAAAYEMQNKYDVAAKDGEAANPDNDATCPDPYFAHANALYLNNQLHDAENVYQRGAEIVPKSSPQQNMLAVKHAQVSALKSNQNQRLSQLLPYEVLSRILSQLSIVDRAQLGMTCRFWNDYMFRKWPHMWHTVNIQKDFPGLELEYIAETYLEAVDGSQVRDLHLEFVDPDFDPYVDMYEGDNFDDVESEAEDYGGTVLDSMDGRWDAIESLTLKYCDETSFRKLSQIVKHSLKAITLNESEHGIGILRAAAQNFPNLQTMTSNLNGVPILDYIKNAVHFSNFRLTSLYLPRQLASIDQICLHAPALVSLTVNSSQVKNYAVLLASVNSYCPALETLNYDPKANQPLCAIHTQPASTAGGLKTLVMRPSKVLSDTNVNAHLASMFQRASKTLQTLNLHLDVLENGKFHALDTLAHSGAPNLQILILEASQQCSIGSQQLIYLISACPSLTNINLKGLNFWHDNVFDTLANLRQLRTVSIGWLFRNPRAPAPTTGQDGLITGQNFRAFFKRAQAMYDFTYSRPGYVHTPNNEFILHLIKEASSSNILSLNLFSTRLTSDTLTRSLEYLKHSKVQTLKTRIACPITNRELNAFASIPCLTHLIIYDEENNINEDKLCALLDQWQRPQMLLVRIHRKEANSVIKGYKADSGTMRQTNEQITNPMLRYSVTSSGPRR